MARRMMQICLGSPDEIGRWLVSALKYTPLMKNFGGGGGRVPIAKNAQEKMSTSATISVEDRLENNIVVHGQYRLVNRNI